MLCREITVIYSENYSKYALFSQSSELLMPKELLRLVASVFSTNNSKLILSYKNYIRVFVYYSLAVNSYVMEEKDIS